MVGSLPNISPPRRGDCILQLGRTGDILNILPVAWRTGCAVMCHADYAPLVEAANVRCEPWQSGLCNWPEALKVASAKCAKVYVTQLFPSRETFPHYTDCWATDEWVRLGCLDDYGTLPLAFPRRDLERGSGLVEALDDGRPMLLYNVRGVSGFYPQHAELEAEIRRRFAGRFNVVATPDCPVICDLLSLYEHAHATGGALITVDTGTLHLCWASEVRNIQFLNDLVDPWLASKPKGRCLANLPYSRALVDADTRERLWSRL